MENGNVPYVVYESACARAERTQRHLVVALILTILLVFASNAIWLYAWVQYDYVGEDTRIEVSSDKGLSNVNIDGEQGDLTNEQDSCYEDEACENEEERAQ